MLKYEFERYRGNLPAKMIIESLSFNKSDFNFAKYELLHFFSRIRVLAFIWSNPGKHTRDFTYIDDIVDGIVKTLDNTATSNMDWNSNNPDPASSKSPWRIYNIGNNKPIKLMDYIEALEKNLGKKANINFLPLQQGDVADTYANIDNLDKQFNYKLSTSVIEGISNFVKWYKKYYNI